MKEKQNYFNIYKCQKIRFIQEVPDEKYSVVQSNRRVIKQRREHCLADRDDQPSVDDELGQSSRSEVRVASVDQQQPSQVFKLGQ